MRPSSTGSCCTAASIILLILVTLLLVHDEKSAVAFTVQHLPQQRAAIPRRQRIPFHDETTATTIATTTALFAVKKKLSAAAAAALAAIEDEKDVLALDEQQPPVLSKKEQLKAMMAKKGSSSDVVVALVNGDEEESNGSSHAAAAAAASNSKGLSKKDLMLQKALELEEADSHARSADDNNNGDDDNNAPKLSAKELKALKKKEEKMAAKLDKKKAKKQSDDVVQEDDEDGEDDSDLVELNGSANGGNGDTAAEADADAEAPFDVDEITLEDKIRKERPPPRIRVMEGVQAGYTSLRMENVGITFRNQEVLKDVTWGVQNGDRIGLVGANGAGKTTQIRILAGELEPTTGDVVKSSKDIRTAVLRQEFVDELVLDRTLREEFLSVFETENKILDDLKAAETALETMPPDEVGKMQDILDRMQELQNLAEDKAVYTLESRIKKVMDLMGFTDDEGDDLVASFSGGWKMRIGLGKALLQNPSVLLLDEPSNHLDLQSVEWLEAFLRQQSIPMVIVSHDREFLDQVCNKIVDAEGGVCTEYNGNYSRFLQLKKARMDSWQAAYDAQEKRISEERRWIQKFKIIQPQAVKQREAKLEKLVKSEDYVKRPPFVGKPFRFRFPDAPRLSPEVAEIKGMSHAYRNEQTQNRLFDDVDLFIQKGDRIAIVGPNGSGKSTFLRLLIGREKPDEGSAEVIGQNVVTSYFEQNQADALDLDKTVLETIQGASTGQSYNELRALLGQFLFKGDAVDKKVASLSGGEKARLSLCCMMLQEHNVLILDEPTNHLDISSKEMMEEALQHYAGSVIIVSHDRFFISRVATTIVAIEDKKLVKYQGDYKSYMEKSQDFKDKIEARYIAGVSRIDSAPIIDLEELEAPTKKKNFGGAKTAGLVTRKNKGIKNAKRMEVS